MTGIVPKRVTRSVKLLTDPDPRYVAFVRNGANQTPFRSVKSAFPSTLVEGKDYSIDEQPSAPVPAKKEAEDMAQPEPAVRSMTFKAAYFPTIAVVKKWLDDGGWDGFTITQKGNLFLAEGDGITDVMFDSLKVLKMAEGVSANVGPLKEEAAKGLAQALDAGAAEDKGSLAEREGATTDQTTPATTQTGAQLGLGAKTTKAAVKPGSVHRLPAAATARVDAAKEAVIKAVAEITKKWSYWEVYSSSETDLNSVMAEAMEDGVPPGMCDLFDACRQSISNVLKSEEIDSAAKKAALVTIGSQFGSVIHAMYMVFDGLAESAEKTAVIKSDKPNTRKWMDQMANFVKGAKVEGAQKLDTWGDQEGPIKPKSPASGEGNNPNADGGALVGDTDKDKIALPDNGTNPTTTEGQTDTAAVKSIEEAQKEYDTALATFTAVKTEDVGAYLAAHKGLTLAEAALSEAQKAGKKPDPAEPDADDKNAKKTVTPGTKTVAAPGTFTAEQVAAVVEKAVKPLVDKVDALGEQVASQKTETDAVLRRAPTKKAAASAGAEETVDAETATKAAAEAEEVRKFDRRMRHNSLGIAVSR